MKKKLEMKIEQLEDKIKRLEFNIEREITLREARKAIEDTILGIQALSCV